MPPLTGVGVNNTGLPAHAVVDGEAAIVTEGTDAANIDRLPKFVPAAPVVIPAIPKSEEEKIYPAAEPEVVACICRFEMVITSKCVVPEALKLMLNAPGLILTTPIDTSLPGAAVVVGNETTNVHPGGGASTRELAPVLKSVTAPSVIVIGPSVVGDVATVLQMLVPPLAPVTVTLAKPARLMQHKISENKVTFIAFLR